MNPSPQPPSSIRRRIFTTSSLLLVIATVVLSVAAYQQAQQAAQSAFDRLLAASALTIANAIQVDEQALSVELPHAALSMLPNNERSEERRVGKEGRCRWLLGLMIEREGTTSECIMSRIV